VLCDYQAAAANDRALAAAMGAIAEDEHAHAALVHAAVNAALTSLPRRAIADAARAGISAAELGVPSPAHAAELAHREGFSEITKCNGEQGRPAWVAKGSSQR